MKKYKRIYEIPTYKERQARGVNGDNCGVFVKDLHMVIHD